MDFLHTDKLTPDAIALMVACLGVAAFLAKASASKMFGVLVAVGSIVAILQYTGALEPDEVSAAAKDAAKGGFDAGDLRARAIGGQAYKTSAGQAGQTNTEYQKRIGQ